MAGKSTDGDPRCLSAMVYEASLSNEIWIKCTQDHTHIGTKVRNRLLKRDIILPMGTHKVSIEHLRNLINNTQKSVHGLTFSDVFPIDRMNYKSFDKIVQERVLIALEQKVPNSKATIQYLKMFRDIVNSYMQFDLNPLERIQLIWRGVYFLRIWRTFLDKSSHYSVAENFITYNAYTCIELNAKALIALIKMFRDRNTHEQFLPALFDSQACERIFRTFRSMGTTQFTKINFSLMELIHISGRVEVENDIKYCKLNVDGIEMPHKRRMKSKFFHLPTDVEIGNTIAKAKDEAFEIARSFEMLQYLENSDQIFDYRFVSKLNINNADGLWSDDEYEDENESDQALLIMPHPNVNEYYQEYVENFEKNANINDESEGVDQLHEIDPMSSLVYVIDEDGERKLIPKSTYLWMITEPGVKLSNDRTMRFKSIGKKRKNTELNQ